MHPCLILLFLSFYSLSLSSFLFFPLPHSAIFPCPIFFLLILLYIFSFFFYCFIFIHSYHFLFLRITFLLNIIIRFKLFRLPLLLILCILSSLVPLISILTHIYLHDLFLFIMFHLLVHHHYSFFVVCYTFVTSPSSYSIYHEVTNFILLVSIRSSIAFRNAAVCAKVALDNCVFLDESQFLLLLSRTSCPVVGLKCLLSMIWYWNDQREISCHSSIEADRIHFLILHNIPLMKE
jgi:hypothetical protein